jgi:hypothetical protein
MRIGGAARWSIVSSVALFLLPTAPTSFPGVQPQLAATGDRVYLAFGLGDTINVARSDDRGEAFEPPVRLPLAGRLSLGMHRGPRVAVTNTTVLVAAVAGSKGGGGLAVSDTGIVATWRRESDVFVSSGQVPERRLGPGRDPVIATAGPHHDIAWSSSAGIMLLRDSAQPVPVAPGRFPTILALKEKTILAWEDQGHVLVRTIPR